MPLTSKDNGPDLQPGDYVKMEWVISRLFDIDVVLVTRSGLGGRLAASPQMVTVRLGTGRSALKTLPNGTPVGLGVRCLLIWQVVRVFPSTGTVLVQRDGIGSTPASPVAVTVRAGALASELEYVPPEDLGKPPKPLGAEVLAVLGQAPREANTPELLPEMLPYGFEPGVYEWGDESGVAAPVLTKLEPETVALGAPSFTLRVLGTGLTETSVILWNGAPELTRYVSSGEVTTSVNMATAEVALTLPVAVQNVSGPLSNALPFTITAAPGP